MNKMHFWNILFVSIFLILLIIYFLTPERNITFKGEGNSNFSIEDNSTFQFYPEMRFPNDSISYKILEDCDMRKTKDMEKAFEFLENETILSFYPVESGEEITVHCQDKQIVNGSFYIAGEGGPTKVINSGRFNVIFSGEILLLKDSECKTPNIQIHELLHVLGFEHSDNENNIMFPISRCNQDIGEDIILLINNLYSHPNKQDLVFGNASLNLQGNYLNLNFSVKNQGLNDSKEEVIYLYADNDLIKEFKIPNLKIGESIEIRSTNIYIQKLKLNEFKLEIPNSTIEFSNENNFAILSKD